MKGGLIGTCFVALMATVLCGCSSAPSDSAVISNFALHKAELEKLVAMLREDSRTLPPQSYLRFEPGEPTLRGLTAARILEYKRLCVVAGSGDGLIYDSQTGRVDFPIWETGLAIGGAAKSISYNILPPDPIFESLDQLPRYSREGLTAYRHVEDHWYLKYDAN